MFNYRVAKALHAAKCYPILKPDMWVQINKATFIDPRIKQERNSTNAAIEQIYISPLSMLK